MVETLIQVSPSSYEENITASTMQTQGQQPLTAEINIVDTVTNNNDTVTLIGSTSGKRQIILNLGANTLQIFPASGDDLGQGVNISTTLDAGKEFTFYGLDNTTWFNLTNAGKDDIVTINFIIDGGGSTITTGIKGHVIVDFDCEILEWAVVADQSGSIVVDVNRSTFANYPTTASIAGTELPTISTSTKGEDRILTSWSDINTGDVLEFEVDSITTCERVTIALKCRKK